MAKRSKVKFDELPSQIQKAIVLDSNQIDQETLLSAIVDKFGGPNEIAATVYREYHDGQPGGITRQRIIEMITRLVINVSENNANLVKRPTDMTDQELKDVAGKLCMAAMESANAKGKTEGVRQEAGPDTLDGDNAPTD